MYLLETPSSAKMMRPKVPQPTKIVTLKGLLPAGMGCGAAAWTAAGHCQPGPRPGLG